MGKSWFFWKECTKRARQGTGSFANDWQWVFGVPIASFVGTYVNSARGGELTTGHPILDAFLAAFVAFVVTWLVAFLIRFLKASEALYYEEKTRADAAWSAEHQIRIELEERARAKIKVLSVTAIATSIIPFTQSIIMEIENDSETLLDDCLAKVTFAELFRKKGSDGSVDDISPFYKNGLPIALRTASSTEIGGGGPFRLRAHEKKKIPICSREGMDMAPMMINFEPGRETNMYQVPSFHSGILEVSIFGAPTPTIHRIVLEVNGEADLEVKNEK